MLTWLYENQLECHGRVTACSGMWHIQCLLCLDRPASEFAGLHFCAQMNQALGVGCLMLWHHLQLHRASKH